MHATLLLRSTLLAILLILSQARPEASIDAAIKSDSSAVLGESQRGGSVSNMNAVLMAKLTQAEGGTTTPQLALSQALALGQPEILAPRADSDQADTKLEAQQKQQQVRRATLPEGKGICNLL